MTGAISSLDKAGLAAARSPQALVDQLLHEAHIHGAAALLTRSGISMRLMKKLAECMLAAELSHHLGMSAQRAAQAGNYRNGSTPKTVATPSGMIELDVPRVRLSTFVPRLVPRYQRRIPGFDEHIMILYGRGIGSAELQSRLRALYGEHAWTELCDTLTREVVLHTSDWQARRLERACALIYFDALPTLGQAEGQATPTPLLFALGMRADGRKEVLGFWLTRATHTAFWHEVLNELKGRGLAEPGTIAGEHLRGLQEAAALVYPAARFHCP